MARRADVKTLDDGRALLNIGCGVRTHRAWNNIDRSPYAWLVRHMTLAKLLRRFGLLSEQRCQRLEAVDPQMIYGDVRKGLPFASDTFEAVYQSYFMGVIDRERVPHVLGECHRVLKAGGTIRVVVRDFEQLVNRYTEAVAALGRGDDGAAEDYDAVLSDIFELMVRRNARGTSEQHFLVRVLERALRGSTLDQGEALRWHYDQHSLGRLLREAGFSDVRRVDAVTSNIEGWAEFALDTSQDGTVYKPWSLYMEATK
jgi:ubiquinone/menaquinone biosynthesis C-methylase UbiE